MYLSLLLRRVSLTLAFALSINFAIASPVFSQEKKEPAAKGKPAEADKKPEEKTPPVYKTKEATFEIKTELDGIFEAKKATQIAIDPKAWADLTIVSVVPHGTAVKKGDIIARFDDEKLKEAIEEKKLGAPIAELTLATAVAELETLEQTTPIDLDLARESKMQAEENLAYFEDVTLPMKKEDVKRGLKRFEQSVAYAEEELNQLKKMYEADDMTEETEEIILKRAEFQAETARWALEQAKTRSDRSLNTTIPREHEGMIKALDKTKVTWRAGEKTLRDALEKKRLEVEKAHRDHDKAMKNLGEMEADLQLLTVKAPHDGIVYYGAAARGKWVTGLIVEKKLVPGGKVTPKEVILTVADPAKQQIRVSVPEAKLKDLKVGLRGIAHPTWNADSKFDSKIESIAYVPFADKTFDAIFTSSKTEKDSIYPGMSAKVSVEVYKKENAIAVPKKAVKKEGDKHFVTMKDGKKREVKVGKSSSSQTEILDGLKAGEEIKTS